VERLDPAVEALGEPGDVLHPGDGDAGRGDGAGGRPGRDELDARGVQRGRELDEALLVVDAQERAADRPARLGGGGVEDGLERSELVGHGGDLPGRWVS
jgi:hypothetical protein